MTSFITDGKDWLNCPWIQLIIWCVEALKPLVVEHCDVCSSAKLMVVSWYQQAIPRNIKTCQNCKDINLWTSICRNRSSIFMGLMMLIISRDVHLFVNWYVYVRNGEQIKTFLIYAHGDRMRFMYPVSLLGSWHDHDSNKWRANKDIPRWLVIWMPTWQLEFGHSQSTVLECDSLSFNFK